MIQLYRTPELYEALKAEGFKLPKNCGDLELDLPVDGLPTLKYRQMLEPEDMLKIAKALARISEARLK